MIRAALTLGRSGRCFGYKLLREHFALLFTDVELVDQEAIVRGDKLFYATGVGINSAVVMGSEICRTGTRLKDKCSLHNVLRVPASTMRVPAHGQVPKA